MLTRRNLLALLGTLGLSGCGGAASSSGALRPDATAPSGPAVTTDPGTRGAQVLARSRVGRAGVDRRALATTTRSLTGFTLDLYRRLASASAGNLVCSPYSVAEALAMTVQGAAGPTADQILRVLQVGGSGDGVGALARGLGSLDQVLASRSRQLPGPDGSPVRVELAAANSLWGQRDLTWQQPFLDVLARDFGTGMFQVDYRAAAEDARTRINDWVSGRTRSRIPQLVPGGALDALTRLVLVNAVYLKAPWDSPFPVTETTPSAFTRPDGTRVTTPRMNHLVDGAGLATGDGWSAVNLPYAGGELAMAVILPDPGRLAAVEASLTPSRLSQLLAGFTPGPVQVGLPRWTTRTRASLRDVLSAMGMPLAFTDRADFSGMTRQERLWIAAVLHEGFIAVDEHGTEAAAASAVIMRAAGALSQPRTFVADRPFLYVLHDVETRTPLFVGRVVDPTV